MYLCHPPRVVHFSLHSGFVLDFVAARYQIQPVATTYSSTFLRTRTLSASSPSLQSLLSASPSLRESENGVLSESFSGPSDRHIRVLQSADRGLKRTRWLVGFTRSISPRDRHCSRCPRHLPARTTVTAVLSTPARAAVSCPCALTVMQPESRTSRSPHRPAWGLPL